MIPTPMQPTRRYGLGAVNWYTGETVVLTRHHKRRREVAELLEALLTKHPSETVYVAWDNASTHQDDEIEAVLRGAAGRLVLLSLPTYSPWLNPIEMLWRQFRARSPIANCSPASTRCSMRPGTFSAATTAPRAAGAPSWAHIPHEF